MNHAQLTTETELRLSQADYFPPAAFTNPCAVTVLADVLPPLLESGETSKIPHARYNQRCADEALEILYDHKVRGIGHAAILMGSFDVSGRPDKQLVATPWVISPRSVSGTTSDWSICHAMVVREFKELGKCFRGVKPLDAISSYAVTFDDKDPMFVVPLYLKLHKKEQRALDKAPARISNFRLKSIRYD